MLNFSLLYSFPDFVSEGNTDCHNLRSEDHINSCLLNSKHPTFDFDHDRFVSVSGYKEAVTDLQSLGLFLTRKARHMTAMISARQPRRPVHLMGKKFIKTCF